MPSVSKAQQRFMGMCTTNEGRLRAKHKCPPVETAKEFARTPRKKLPARKTKGK